MATILDPIKADPRLKWYYQMLGGKHYDEKTLQSIISHKLKELLPNHFAIYYDRIIVSRTNRRNKCKPDFMLWNANYTEWYIIEVEMENHEINHMSKQLNTFHDGDYSDVNGIVNYVSTKEPKTDRARLTNLIATTRPKLILMADEIQDTWVKTFEMLDCRFSTLQVYTDVEDNILYRIGGDFPQEYAVYSYCKQLKNLRGVIVESPAFVKRLQAVQGLNFIEGAEVTIYITGRPFQWEYQLFNGQHTLSFIGDLFPLNQTVPNYKLILNEINQLHFIR